MAQPVDLVTLIGHLKRIAKAQQQLSEALGDAVKLVAQAVAYIDPDKDSECSRNSSTASSTKSYDTSSGASSTDTSPVGDAEADDVCTADPNADDWQCGCGHC